MTADNAKRAQNAGIGTWKLSGNVALTIGPLGDIELAGGAGNAAVSIRWTGRAVEIRALGTNRPTVEGHRVLHARVAVGSDFSVDGATFVVSAPGVVTRRGMRAAPPKPAGSQPASVVMGNRRSAAATSVGGGALRRWRIPEDKTYSIGREGGSADIALSGLDLAHRHATVRWTGRAVEIRSLSPAARPFVDGVPVLHARVRVGSHFMVGHHTFVVSDVAEIALLAAPVVSREPLLQLHAVSLQYRKPEPDKPGPTLKEVSLELARGEVLAVIGPSGAGKSTLCGGLLGEVATVAGTVRLGEVDLASARSQANHLVSFVPQKPAVYGNLTVRQSLGWVARLRLSPDTTRQERARRIDAVVEAMALTDDVNQPVAKLSGGQLKRASTAMELLSDPMLLILDEPTSGLDEGLDRAMMDSLRDTAREHDRAVIVVTHSMVNIDRADKVLALTKEGRPGFFGPSAELLTAFSSTSYAEVMDHLRAGVRTEHQASPSPGRTANADVTPSPPVKGSFGRHVPHLICREFARQLSNKRQLVTTLLGAIALTAGLSWAASSHGLGGSPKSISSMLLAFIVCLTFFSMAQSFASIVDDRDVIERESRWSISASAMVLARAISCIPFVVVLGIASSLLYVVIKPNAPVDPVLPHPAGLVLFGMLLPFAAMTLGLLISAVSPNLRRAVFTLMAVLALLVVLTGLAPPFEGTPGQAMRAVAFLSPTRWTSAGLGADYGITLPFNGTGPAAESPPTPTPGATPTQGPLPSPFTDEIWAHDLTHIVTAAGALLAICVVALVCSCIVLHRWLLRAR